MAKPYFPLMRCWFLLLLMPQLAVCHSAIKFLPGFEGPLPFELETGYVGVGESEDVQLFYYFIKSERNPREDPLLIWISGGPACSSLSGLVYEIGPLTFKVEEYNGTLPTLVSTSYSWTKVASIIFLDSPVGSGFSYARTVLASQASDSKQVYQIHQFVRKWLVNHPEFISNHFYVGGDSYSGLVIPALVQQISNGNQQGVKPLINFQGYLLGNPKTDESFDGNSKIPYVHGMGLISDELYESLKKSCGENYVKVDPSNSKCLKDLQAYRKCVSGLYEGQFLLANCDVASPKPRAIEFGQRRNMRELTDLELSLPFFGCYMYRYLLAAYWANDETVRRALHVRKGSIGKWVRCNLDNIPYTTDIHSSLMYHVNNSAKGFRSLISSGDHDLAVPFLGTQAWIRALNYSIVDDWRPWMLNGQVAGYTRTYANRMTFATIKASHVLWVASLCDFSLIDGMGGGHTVEYTPEEGYAMFERWISGKPL